MGRVLEGPRACDNLVAGRILARVSPAHTGASVFGLIFVYLYITTDVKVAKKD
jgi:hypothetical protein